jgi:MtrB/PioB family decaheme-associated outer membrane protein
MNPANRKSLFRMQPLAAAIAMALCAPAHGEPLFQVPLYGNADMTRYETNNVEIGIGYPDINGSRYKFGEWTGLFREDVFAIGNLNYLSRDMQSGSYASAWGWNLGVPTREIGGSIGKQGLWGLSASFGQITHAQTDDAKFIFNGIGSDRLTLPANFPGISAPITNNVPASQPPANAAAINAFEQGGFGVKTERDIYKLAGSWKLGHGFEATANFRYDQRDGTRITGAVMGNTGGNPRSVLVPYPIDDNTTQVEAALDYFSQKFQFKLSYWYSKYSNDKDSFTWQNPYAAITGWDGAAGVGFPTGFGRMSLPPDNDFNQIQATGGYNFSPTTRLTATYQYGVARQNDVFLPQTINVAPLVNPGLQTPYPMPADSLDGKIKNNLFDITLTSRPIDKLSVKLNYHYNDHDNTTPDRIFVYTPGDTLSQVLIPSGKTPEDVNSNYIRTNPIPGITENRFQADADYPLMRGLVLRGFYEYKKTDYRPAEDELRSDTHVNEVGAELKFRGNPMVNGYLKYVYDERRGADFSTNRPYAAVVNLPTLVFNNFDTNPTMRQFFVADYNQNRLKAQATVTPGESPFSLQLMGDWWKRDYKGPNCGGSNDQLLLNQTPPIVFPSECLGLQDAQGQTYTVDAQYAAPRGISLYAFVTWSRYDTDQRGRTFSSVSQGATTIAQSADPTRDWMAESRTTDTAVGAGLDWKPEGKPYSAGVQYLYNDGVTALSLAPGPAFGVAQGLALPTAIPDAKNTLNSLQIFGRWQYSKNLLFRANYWYQHFSARNWAYDNATPTSSNNVLLTGQSSGSYNANVFGISVAYTNW